MIRKLQVKLDGSDAPTKRFKQNCGLYDQVCNKWCHENETSYATEQRLRLEGQLFWNKIKKNGTDNNKSDAEVHAFLKTKRPLKSKGSIACFFTKIKKPKLSSSVRQQLATPAVHKVETPSPPIRGQAGNLCLYVCRTIVIKSFLFTVHVLRPTRLTHEDTDVAASNFCLFLQSILPCELFQSVGVAAQSYHQSNASFATMVNLHVATYLKYEESLQEFRRMRTDSGQASALRTKINAIAAQTAQLSGDLVSIFGGMDVDGSSFGNSRISLQGRTNVRLVAAVSDVATAIVALGVKIEARDMGSKKNPTHIIKNLQKSVSRTRRDSGSTSKMSADNTICRYIMFCFFLILFLCFSDC